MYFTFLCSISHFSPDQFANNILVESYRYLYTFCDKVRWAGPEISDLSRKSALCVIVCIRLTTNCGPFLIVFVRHRLSELFRPFQVENMICFSRCFQWIPGFLVAVY